VGCRDRGLRQTVLFGEIDFSLNGPGGLTLEAVDRLLDALRVDIVDLADAEELRLQALQRPERELSFDSVPLVSPRDVVLSPPIPPRQVLDSLKFRKRFLNSLTPRNHRQSQRLVRFVIVRPRQERTRHDAADLRPPPGCCSTVTTTRSSSFLAERRTPMRSGWENNAPFVM